MHRKKQLTNLLRICLFAGLSLWLFGGLPKTYNLYHYFGASNWPQVKAIITESSVTKTYSSSASLTNCSTPKIEYQYNHHGNTMTSNKWGFPFLDCSSSHWAHKITARYKTGSHVTAYVNPTSGIAVLEPSLLMLYLTTFIGLFCGVLIWLIRPKDDTTIT